MRENRKTEYCSLAARDTDRETGFPIKKTHWGSHLSISHSRRDDWRGIRPHVAGCPKIDRYLY